MARRKLAPQVPVQAQQSAPGRPVSGPSFAQPAPSPDPTTFLIKHASDAGAYAAIDALNKQHKLAPTPFTAPRGGIEPRLTLEAVYGGNAAAAKLVKGIVAAGQIVFHAGGDCGSTKGPATQNLVVDKMLGDFHEAAAIEVPQFNLLLGDIVYSFGETKYYYDQFYEPYRDYPAPILALPGNHDGMVAPETQAKSLAAYLRNFCSAGFVVLPEAGGLTRTAQIQPGVFFTFEAPYARIITLYSNTLEDPGYIADGPSVAKGTLGTSQLDFLLAALERVKTEKFAGALLFASHHPAYAGGGQHGGSAEMLKQIDTVCSQVGVWPHAVLAGHAHSYQRFTRTRSDGTQIPYLICGNSGHNVQKLRRSGPPTRTPQILQPASARADEVVFENYDDQNYGYLRVIATANQLRVEHHPASDGRAVKTPDDAVTVDLATRKLVHYQANDLGYPAAARKARQSRQGF